MLIWLRIVGRKQTLTSKIANVQQTGCGPGCSTQNVIHLILH